MLLLAHLSAMMDMLIVLVLNLYNDPQNPGFHQAGREPMYDSRYGSFLNGNLKQEHLFSPSETTRLSQIAILVYTRLPQTKIAPENGWLEDEYPFGMVRYQLETCVYDSDWFSSPEMDSQCKRILLLYHILGFRYLYVDVLYCKILYTCIRYIQRNDKVITRRLFFRLPNVNAGFNMSSLMVLPTLNAHATRPKTL